MAPNLLVAGHGVFDASAPQNRANLVFSCKSCSYRANPAQKILDNNYYSCYHQSMKIVEEKEAWIYTHFIVDSFFITESERRQISTRVEPELIQLGIQYGLTYTLAPSKHRAIIVLECIPFDAVKAAVKQLINDVIADFPVRHPEQRNVVTNITVVEPEPINARDLGQ